MGCIWQSENTIRAGGASRREFSPRHRKPSRWHRITGYFQRKYTNSRPKFLESFSTR